MKEKMSESNANDTNNKLFKIDIFPTSGNRKYERYVNKGDICQMWVIANAAASWKHVQ